MYIILSTANTLWCKSQSSLCLQLLSCICKTEASRFSLRPNKKLHAGLIGLPQNDLRHIGHVGYDGAIFGDVSFIGDNYSKLPIKVGNTQASHGLNFHTPVLSRQFL